MKKINWDYSKLAKSYDARADYSNILINKIAKRIKLKKNYPVADIGAGTGKLTKLLVRNNYIVAAIEPNFHMMEFGKKNIIKYRKIFNWKKGTAEKTNLPNNSFYAVFFGSSFNVVNYTKAFKEIKRILIPKGYFCCMWNHRDLNDPFQKRIENIIKDEIPNYSYGDRRKNIIPILRSSKIFKKIKKISVKFNYYMTKNDVIKAWKSHATLEKQSGTKVKFLYIINKINKLVRLKKENKILVPYQTVAYIAQLN
jgi:ubiquinone/menaquinone biosynthesis C-methylase UbiE